MSNQTQKSTQPLMIIVLAILVIFLFAGTAAIILMQGRIKQLENVAYSGDSAFLTKEVVATLPPTDLPVQPTYTPWISPTPRETYTPEPPLPTNTPYPTDTPQPTKTPYHTPVFMFNVDEVLYLNSSISSGDYWNPDKPTPFVEEVDRINILALLQNAQWYREYVWRWEDYSDLWVYNDGYALTQLNNYYDYYIDPNDNCYVEIDIVGSQFHTIITSYDGLTAKTMTIKVESRNHICDGASKKWVAGDGYAYEMKVQKFSDGMGGYLWKIVEHPLGSDPSQ